MIKKILNFVSLVFATTDFRLSSRNNRGIGCLLFIFYLICFTINTAVLGVYGLSLNLIIIFVIFLARKSDTNTALYRELPVNNRFAICCILYTIPVINMLCIIFGTLLLIFLYIIVSYIIFLASKGSLNPYTNIESFGAIWESILFLILFICIVWLIFATITFINNNTKRTICYYTAFTGIYGALISLGLYLRQFKTENLTDFDEVFPHASGAGIILILTGVLAAALIVISYYVGMKLYPNSAPVNKNDISIKE